MRGRSLSSLAFASLPLAALSPYFSLSLSLSLSLCLSRFSAPFDLHTVSLSGLIARARLFPSVHERALLCNEEKTYDNFDRIFRQTKRK